MCIRDRALPFTREESWVWILSPAIFMFLRIWRRLLLASSLITAVCVSFLGIIGFVGIICPHAVKRLIGHDHRWALPASALCGSALLLAADALSRSLGSGSALPVGAITSLLGAPFFLALIFGRKESRVC